MKHTTPSYITSQEHLPAKKKSYPNGSAGKKYHVGKNTKATFVVKKVSKKVHSNINFSELNEVCRDVGKVDLSCSARLTNDSGFSPLKGPKELNGDFQHLESMGSLESTQKSSFGRGPRVSSSLFRDEDEEWKGWTSRIIFSQQHGCPMVEIKEGSKVSEVLVMDEDLVESECKILEKCNGYKLNRSNFKSILGTCEIDKSNEEKNFELKEKIQELFHDTSELQNFVECVDLPALSPQFQTPQNKSCKRKLNYAGGEIDVPNTSNRNVGATSERSDSNMHRGACSNCVYEADTLFGFSDGAIYLAGNYARNFIDYYEKYTKEIGIIM